MNQQTPIRWQQDFIRFINYDTTKYVADFNQIMYNQLLEQAYHNEDINVKKVDAKIAEVKEKALECYNKINSEVDSDVDVSNNFVDLIMQQLMTALQKDQIKRFRTKMYGVDADIKKADVIADSNNRFQQAQDQETIIQHIISPVELEKAVFI